MSETKTRYWSWPNPAGAYSECKFKVKMAMVMVLKKMGRVAGLVFGSYVESVMFRKAMITLIVYAVLFGMGYHMNLIFGDDKIAPILDGYAMTSLFAGLHFLSGAMDRTILVGGCLVVLFTLVLRIVISLVVGAIILPFSVTYNIYMVVKNGYLLVKYGIDG